MECTLTTTVTDLYGDGVLYDSGVGLGDGQGDVETTRALLRQVYHQVADSVVRVAESVHGLRHHVTHTAVLSLLL